MTIKRVILALLAAAALARPALAAEPELLLDDLVAEALRNSPMIAERRAMQAVAERRVPQAGAWPEPMFSVGVRNMGLLLSVGADPMSSLNIGVSQMFPFPGKTGLRQEVARGDVLRTEAELERTRLEVVARLKTAYFDLYENERATEVTREVQNLLRQVARAAITKYSVGQVSQVDVLKARVEIARMQDDLLMLRSRREALQGTINGLLGRPPLAPLGRPVTPQLRVPAVAPEAMASTVRAQSPVLRAAQADIHRAGAALALARKEYLPDFTLMAGYMSRGSMAGGWEVSLSVNLPVFFKSRQDQMVLESQAMQEQARRAREAAAQDVLVMLREALAMARTATEQEELYRTAILPQARATVQSAVASYAVGKIDFLMLYDSLMVLRNFERQYAGVIAGGNRALAQIEALTGASPEETAR